MDDPCDPLCARTGKKGSRRVATSTRLILDEADEECQDHTSCDATFSTACQRSMLCPSLGVAHPCARGAG
eukprot:scaffold80_cov325-Pavlova_lutheri.AAC.3